MTVVRSFTKRGLNEASLTDYRSSILSGKTEGISIYCIAHETWASASLTLLRRSRLPVSQRCPRRLSRIMSSVYLLKVLLLALIHSRAFGFSVSLTTSNFAISKQVSASSPLASFLQCPLLMDKCIAQILLQRQRILMRLTVHTSADSQGTPLNLNSLVESTLMHIDVG